jgi:cytochrome c
MKKPYVSRLLRPAALLLAAGGLLSYSFRADDPVKPEENRFTKVVLSEKLDEPMEMAPLNDGRVLFIERKGALRVYDPTTKAVRTLATIPVNTKYTNRQGQVREAEEGLMGLVQDPNFDQNHWIYLYYADPNEKQHTLARYELRGDELVQASKKVLLNVPTQREECCHTGGGMTFDKVGNLFLTVGNNTSNSNSDGYAPIDERPDQANWDDQRGAASTNDYRGKILRIHPEADGSYTIPAGNLFPKGTPNTKPEIYTMGHRNPWRISVDSKTGYIYWGEVGPDASNDSERGPRGYDEFNQAKGPGFFGWPYFIGNNIAYSDYNFETKQVGPKFDPAHPVNDSPNNTGLRELPPAQPAMIWYPYAASPEFPLVGASGRSATGGPVYHRADFPTAKRPFPAYYENKWLIVEFMRGWIMAVTLDENGNFKSMERFLPNESFQSAIDMKFAPDGDLYVLEYGSAWFRGNDNARLVKIEYNAGNRPPVAVASASKTSGAVPLKVTLSADGSKDFDGDALTYAWTVSGKGQPARKFAQARPVVSFDKPGTYTATLTVTDPKGAKATRTLNILAGNETPAVAFDVTKGNQTFFFPNQPIEYAVRVSDREDGSLANGKITPAQVAVTIDYLATYDPIELAQSHRGSEATARSTTGKRLIDASDCKACHMVDKKSVGPSYQDVAKKYKGDAGATERLAKKVIAGGGGVWGDHAMSAHPQLSQADATAMVDYILAIDDKPAAVKSLPVTGSYTLAVPAGQAPTGAFVLRAAYTDRGGKTIPALTGEGVRYLRSASVNPEKADVAKGTELFITPGRSFYVKGDGSYLGFKGLDLTGISQVEVAAMATQRVGAVGGTVEVRLDSPTGPLVGQTGAVEVRNPPMPGAAPAAGAQRPANAQAGGNAPGAAAPGAAAPAGGGMAAAMRRMAQTVKADLTPTSGLHDVYFVFKNPKATPDQFLMQLMSIQFVPTGQKAAN